MQRDGQSFQEIVPARRRDHLMAVSPKGREQGATKGRIARANQQAVFVGSIRIRWCTLSYVHGVPICMSGASLGFRNSDRVTHHQAWQPASLASPKSCMGRARRHGADCRRRDPNQVTHDEGELHEFKSRAF